MRMKAFLYLSLKKRYNDRDNNVGDNVTLRSNQYVQVKDIVVRIPNAIKVTL